MQIGNVSEDVSTGDRVRTPSPAPLFVSMTCNNAKKILVDYTFVYDSSGNNLF